MKSLIVPYQWRSLYLAPLALLPVVALSCGGGDEQTPTPTPPPPELCALEWSPTTVD